MPPPKRFEVRQILAGARERYFIYNVGIHLVTTPRYRVFHTTNITIVYHRIKCFATIIISKLQLNLNVYTSW